jgi:drug/metabolite transporter (DMT)-like permease
VVATALVFAVQTWAQRHTPASRAALLFALEPVFAALAAFAFAGERLGGRALAGSALILAGILRVELKPRTQTQDLY